MYKQVIQNIEQNKSQYVFSQFYPPSFKQIQYRFNKMFIFIPLFFLWLVPGIIAVMKHMKVFRYRLKQSLKSELLITDNSANLMTLRGTKSNLDWVVWSLSI